MAVKLYEKDPSKLTALEESANLPPTSDLSEDDDSNMAGDMTPAAGDMAPTAGDLAPTAGDMAPTAGDMTPTDMSTTAAVDMQTDIKVEPIQVYFALFYLLNSISMCC